MTSLATTRNVLTNNFDQENPGKSKGGAIIKKRTAAPVTRSAFVALSNNVTGQRVSQKGNLKPELKKPLIRQAAAANLKAKSNDQLKRELKALPKSQTILKVKEAKIQNGSTSPTPMEMGTPNDKLKLLQKNIFDRTDKPEVEDIDENDTENPQLCSEFVNDIYQYMLYLEGEFPVKKHYLKDTTLKPRMRSILVDWLFQVHHRFQLLQETFYLTIAILDRFLQLEPVARTKLQLAGVTAMLISSKYEEMYAPEVNDFVYITDQAFTRSQILQMEIVMLKKLDFDLGRPLPLHFLRRNSKAGQVDANQHTLAKYLMELSMVDYEMCHVAPSKVAAAALCLSIKLLEDTDWTPTLEHYSQYSQAQLWPVVSHLAKNLKSAETNTYLQAIRTKYSSHKAFKIAQIAEVNSSLVIELSEKAASITL